jgi:hypothetical protein
MSDNDWLTKRLTTNSSGPIIIGGGPSPLFDSLTRTAASGTVHTWPTSTAAGSGYWDSSAFGMSKTFATGGTFTATWPWSSGTVWPRYILSGADEKLIEEFLIESFARGFAKEQAA